jgi:regulator of replication initiation timing
VRGRKPRSAATTRDALTAANAAIADREGDIADIQARLDAQVRETDALRDGETRIRRLEAELEAARAQSAARERELLQSRADLQQARLDWRKESEVAMAIALSDYKKGEGERLQAAEAQGHQHSQASLSKMAQRLKQAEADLQQSRAHAEALARRGDSEDIKQLRKEFGHLQAQLAQRDQEIAQLRLDSEHARERWAAEARLALQKAEHDWKAEAEDSEDGARRSQTTRRYIRDAVLAASFSAIAVLLYLSTDIAGVWSTYAGAPSSAADAGTPQPAVAAMPGKTAEAHLVTIVRAANVRAAPSKTAAVLATLPRETEVASLERRGNWVHVKIEGAAARKDGWVYSTFAKDKAVASAVPASGRP